MVNNEKNYVHGSPQAQGLCDTIFTARDRNAQVERLQEHWPLFLIMQFLRTFIYKLLCFQLKQSTYLYIYSFLQSMVILFLPTSCK